MQRAVHWGRSGPSFKTGLGSRKKNPTNQRKTTNRDSVNIMALDTYKEVAVVGRGGHVGPYSVHWHRFLAHMTQVKCLDSVRAETQREQRCGWEKDRIKTRRTVNSQFGQFNPSVGLMPFNPNSMWGENKMQAVMAA